MRSLSATRWALAAALMLHAAPMTSGGSIAPIIANHPEPISMNLSRDHSHHRSDGTAFTGKPGIWGSDRNQGSCVSWTMLRPT